MAQSTMVNGRCCVLNKCGSRNCLSHAESPRVDFKESRRGLQRAATTDGSPTDPSRLDTGDRDCCQIKLILQIIIFHIKAIHVGKDYKYLLEYL